MATYQSITLLPGQIGYVPKNAKIVSVSQTGDTGPVSDCVDLDNVPATVCYTFLFNADDEAGEQTRPHTSGGINLIGVTTGGIEYPIGPFGVDENGRFDLDAIISALKGVPEINVLTSGYNTGQATSGSRGTSNFISFKTIPSFADQIFLVFTSALQDFGQIVDKYRIYPQLQSYLVSLGFDTPACIDTVIP
jgi:hypothetical protein